MRRLILLSLAVSLCTMTKAQTTARIEDSGADEIVRIWDNSSAPHSNCETRDETVDKKNRFHRTSSLDLYIYRADKATATGQSVVIFPGGSYISVNFGRSVARFYRDLGITAAVAKYRLPNCGHYEATLEDAVRSVRYMRENAERLGIDPAKVGVSGSSAGGHLASWVSNRMPGEEPAFAILIYPACVRSEWYIGSDGPVNLMGRDITPVISESLNTPAMVNEHTPRTLILHSDDDLVVHPFSAIEYYKALKRYGVPAVLHIYPSGKHGWSGKTSFKYNDQWKQAARDFLAICNEANNENTR